MLTTAFCVVVTSSKPNVLKSVAYSDLKEFVAYGKDVIASREQVHPSRRRI